jgi:hypothetical protein
MEEPNLRALRALTLFVAVCEQTTLELEPDGGFAALIGRIDDLHDVAVEAVRSRLAERAGDAT